MRKLLALVGVVALAGCDQSTPIKFEKAEKTEIGRWKIVAAGNDEKDKNYEGWNAWRLDTKTGALEFCTYSLITGGNGMPNQSLLCSNPNTPSP
jgi:hypothetical protein